MSQHTHNHRTEPRSKTDPSLTFRRLWTEQVLWTRLFLISAAADMEDLHAVTVRLFRNPADFGTELQKFYGREKAGNVARLMTDHLILLAQLAENRKREEEEAAGETRKKWFDCAGQLASYFAEINPYWNQRDWQSMLYSHLKATEEQAVRRLRHQYSADVALYDRIQSQALEMADAMSRGILRQFEKTDHKQE